MDDSGRPASDAKEVAKQSKKRRGLAGLYSQTVIRIISYPLAALAGAGLYSAAATANIANTGQFVRDFVTSAGFGGIAAVVGATIAYLGIRKTVTVSMATLDHQRATERLKTWWATFQWTADGALPDVDGKKGLPVGVVEATLQELATTAENNAQSIACGKLLDHLLTGQVDIERSADGATSDSGNLGKDLQAVESIESTPSLETAVRYNNATSGTAAESAVARYIIYEAEVQKQLRQLFPEAHLLREPKQEDRSTGRRWTVPDFLIKFPDDRQVMIEVTLAYNNGRKLAQWNELQQQWDLPLVVVAPGEVPGSREKTRMGKYVNWVSWDPNGSSAKLAEVIRGAAAPASSQH